MKTFISILLVLTFTLSRVVGQNQTAGYDSLEYAFKRLTKNVKIPCSFSLEFDKNENGSMFFCGDEINQLRFDFFLKDSLPFFKPNFSNFETIIGYDEWLNQNRGNFNNKSLLIKSFRFNDFGYWVYKIPGEAGFTYQLVSIQDNSLMSIRIFDKKMPEDNQLEKLHILYTFNKISGVQLPH